MRRHSRPRLVAAASTVTLVGLSSLALMAAPAAAGQCDRPSRYAASASADLLKVGLLDLRPLGLDLPAAADITVGSTKAGMSATAPINSSASAQYADARLLGLKLPTGPLDGRVYQQAPPSHTEPVRNNASSIDLGLVKAGTGDLLAHARWTEAMGCGKQTGPAGSSSAALLDASLLAGSRGALVKAPRNLSSKTTTGTGVRRGQVISAAGAEIGLARLELLGGGITVKVIHAPQLTVFATGRAATSTVEYSSPILEISGPGLPTRRLSGLNKSIELAVPAAGTAAISPLALAGARQRALTEGLPLVGGNPLGGLLSGLPVGSLTSTIGQLSGTTGEDLPLPALPELGDLPVLGGLLGGGTGSGLLGNGGRAVLKGGSGSQTSGAPALTSGLTGTSGEIAVVKISIGDLRQHISDNGVTAQAASLRVQLQALSRKGTETQDRCRCSASERATVLDLGVGLLKASAAAPKSTSYSPSPSTSTQTPPSDNDASPTPSQPGDHCGTPGCKLPRTGTSIALIAGAGTVLFVAGRFLLLLARRRNLGGPEDLLG